MIAEYICNSLYNIITFRSCKLFGIFATNCTVHSQSTVHQLAINCTVHQQSTVH